MADQTLKIVQSPVITDAQLPLPVHYNGLDQPILNDYALGGDFVKKSGDSMTGALIIKGDDIDNTLHSVSNIMRSAGSDTLVGGMTRLLAGVVVSSSGTVLTNNDASSILAELAVGDQFPTDGNYTGIDIYIHGF